MQPGLVVKLRPSGPWRIGPDSGARNQVDAIYHSDSLYGAVTSAMARLGALDEWLSATARSEEPAVCFSSCFPFLDEIGFVVPPRSVWPPSSPALLSARVRWKSARFVPLGIVQAILDGRRLDGNEWAIDGPSECLVPAGRPGPFRMGVRWNAAVDRLSGATERHSTACIEFRPGAGLWTLVAFANEAARGEWMDRVKAAFRLLADSGFGGERSRGWGRAETPEFVDGMLPEMILGPGSRGPGAGELVTGGREPEAVEASGPDVLPGPPINPPEEPSPIPPIGEPDPAPPPPDPDPELPPTAPPEPATAEAEVSAAPLEAGAGDQGPGAGEASGPAVSPAPPTQEPESPLAVPEPVTAEAEVSAAPLEGGAEDQGPEASGVLPAPPLDALPEPSPPPPTLEPEPPPLTPPEPSTAEAEVRAAPMNPALRAPEPAAEPPAQAAAENAAEAAPEAAPEPPAPGPRPPDPASDIVQAAPQSASEAPAPGSRPAPASPSPASPHWLLSLFTPAPADSVDWARGCYTVLTRGGRIDSPAGSGELKKQLNMVAEGSVVYAASAPRGSAPDVAPDGFAHPVFRAGFAVSIPLPRTEAAV